MRKLFVLFLLVALVPFTVGCNGLWDFDDDTDPVATTLVKLSRTIPAGTFATKAQTVAYVEDLTYVVDGITMIYDSHTFNDAGDLVVIFKATIPTTTYTALQKKATDGTAVATQLKLGTTVVASEAAAALPTTIPTATTTTAAIVAITTPVTVDLKDVPNLVVPVKVSKVEFGTTEILKDAQGTPAVVTSQTPTFKVTFDQAVVDAANATFELKVTNLTNNNSYTLTTVAQGGLTVTPVTGENAVNIAVGTNATINKTLLTGKKYSVALVKTNLKTAAGAPLALPGTYFFTTNF